MLEARCAGVLLPKNAVENTVCGASGTVCGAKTGSQKSAPKQIVLQLEVGGPNNVSWADVADALQQALASYYYSSVDCVRTTKQCRERCVLAAPPSTALRFPQQPPTISASLRRFYNVLDQHSFLL